MPPLVDDKPAKGARAESWYVNGDEIEYGAGICLKYGDPRTMALSSLKIGSSYKGVALGADGSGEFIYIFVNPQGCIFQPYQYMPR